MGIKEDLKWMKQKGFNLRKSKESFDSQGKRYYLEYQVDGNKK